MDNSMQPQIKEKNKKIVITLFVALAFVLAMVLGIFIGIFIPDKNSKDKSTILVYNPVTQEVLESFDVITVKYTGEPIVFDYDLKVDSEKYPKVSKKYIKMSYNGNSYDIDNAIYPQDEGVYEITLYFRVNYEIAQYHDKLEGCAFKFSLIVEN